MKSNRLYLIAALSPVLALAAAGQTAPPAPPPPPTDSPAPPPTAQIQLGSPTTHSSRVSAVIYGAQGEVQAFTLRNGVAVTLTPDLGMRLQSSVTKGTRVQVSGMERVVAGQASLVAQSVTAGGQTFVAAARLPDRTPGLASEPPPPAGPLEPRGPRARRGPGAPPPPPNGAAPPPPPPGDTGAPPTPDGTATPPPPAGTTRPSPPQM